MDRLTASDHGLAIVLALTVHLVATVATATGLARTGLLVVGALWLGASTSPVRQLAALMVIGVVIVRLAFL